MDFLDFTGTRPVMGIFNQFMDELFPDPSKGAMGYLNQIPGQMKPYLEPYNQAGQRALGPLEQSYGQQMNDPGALLKRLGMGYQQSPGYEFERNQGLTGIQNAAASGGMLGTGQHQQQAGELATNLANKDYNQYLQNALGQHNLGQQGMSGLAQLGQGAGSELAQSLAQMLMSQAGLQYAGQANRNQQTGGLLGNLAGMFAGGMGG